MVGISIDPNVSGISKSQIEKFIEIVPEKDLEGLNGIIIDDWKPKIGWKGYYDDEKKLVVIAGKAIGSLEEFAHGIFHEIAHHVQHKNPEWARLRRKVVGIWTKTDPELDKQLWGEADRLDKEFEKFAESYADEKLKEYRSRLKEVGRGG